MINDMFSIAQSGLRAHGQAMAGFANNVANMNTPGYRPVEAVFETQKGGGVQVHHRQHGQAPAPDRSGTDVVQEAANSITYKAGYQANLAVVRSGVSMVGTLLDMMG